MIDLRNKQLPNCINVDGETYRINTDYRYWLDFSKSNEKTPFFKFENLFACPVPANGSDWWSLALPQLIAFHNNPNFTPKVTDSKSNVPIIDFIEDGEYIYASFLQAYQIDLIEINYLHWWKFQALFRSLPSDTKINEIMRFRAYKPTSMTLDTQYAKTREIWRLNRRKTAIEQSVNDEINSEFYGCI